MHEYMNLMFCVTILISLHPPFIICQFNPFSDKEIILSRPRAYTISLIVQELLFGLQLPGSLKYHGCNSIKQKTTGLRMLCLQFKIPGNGLMLPCNTVVVSLAGKKDAKFHLAKANPMLAIKMVYRIPSSAH